MNCSSVVLKVEEKNVKELISSLEKTEFCEFQLYDKGNVIVTIECDSTEEEVSRLYQLQKIQNVLSVDLVYSYCEDYLTELRGNIEIQDEVPEVLNDDSLKAEDIKYSGNLKS